jgi:pimeloyl-ACP methyl ester carboxylesterase
MSVDAATFGTGSRRVTAPPFSRTVREAVAFLTRSPALSIDDLARGDGRPVLVLPPWFCGDPRTAKMRVALRSLGYAAAGWGLGANLGPTPRLLDGAAERLSALFEAQGPVTVVGFSMGGLFARWLGQTMPHRVRSVITVGTPIRDPMHSFWLPVAPFTRLWRGVDVAALAEQVAGPMAVPVTALFTPDDGLVDPAACYDEAAGAENNIAYRGGHVVMARNQEVLTILARRLAL